MTYFASLDIGTNSQLMLIAKQDASGKFSIIEDKAVITRLGQEISKSQKLRDDAIERNIQQLKEYRSLLDQYNVSKVAAVGTMCLRTAKNANEFIKRAAKETGINIEIISGQEEARLTYLGARLDLPSSTDDIMIFDLGGGSTEFIFGNQNEIKNHFSLEVGAVKMTDQFLLSDPVTKIEFDNLIEFLDDQALNELESDSALKSIIAVGGTATTLASMHHKLVNYDRTIVHQTRISINQIEDFINELRILPISERQKIVGLEDKRADVMLAGTLIVRAIMRKYSASEIIVSDHGLRHGLIIDLFGQKSSKF
jgi:exopolyphosphatase/guanosine-5'-triphosphate,3'-diphosphate pyrophosphatase